MSFAASRLSHRLLKSAPALALTILILCGALPWLWPSFVIPLVMISWIGVYYWSLFRPHALPIALLFFLGVLQDIIASLPLGCSSFSLLLIHVIVVRFRTRIATQHFIAIWLGFGALCLMLCTAQWMIFSLLSPYSGNMLFINLFASTMMTWLIYPLMHVLFNRLYNLLPPMQRSVHPL